jgi:hypothetical protein
MARPEIIPSHYQLAVSISDCSRARFMKIIENGRILKQGDFHLLQSDQYWKKAGKKQAYQLFKQHLQKRIDNQQVWIDLN